MSAGIAWRIGVLIALAVGAWYIVDLIGDNATLRGDLKTANDNITALGTRAAALEEAMAANQSFDDEVRSQTSTVRVVVDTAKRSDPNAATVLATPLPAALRKRVFLNDDPTGGTAYAEDAAAARSDRGEVP